MFSRVFRRPSKLIFQRTEKTIKKHLRLDLLRNIQAEDRKFASIRKTSSTTKPQHSIDYKQVWINMLIIANL